MVIARTDNALSDDSPASPPVARPAPNPVNELVNRLMQIDGQLWLALMLETGPTGRLGAPRDALCHGRASLEQLRAMKRECKHHLRRSRDPEIRLGALAGYFAIIAAALVHYGQLICNGSRSEIEPVLLELSEVTPRAWSVMFMQAAVVPDRTKAAN